jgi:hypothetical protein
MKRYQRRSSIKSEAQKKREAKEKSARALEKTKRRLGVGDPQPLRGATPSPLVTKGWERTPRAAPTSDRIPGAAPLKDLMHAHQWKRGAEEKVSTVKEIRRKARQIGPAYNKGALQYLPSAGLSDEPDKAAAMRNRARRGNER